MTQQAMDPNAILMGGGGGPTWKFDAEGVRKVGTIAAPPTARQETEYDPNNPGGGAPKFFPSGDPIMGIVVEVQTDERDGADDDGTRTWYVEGKRLKDALRAAVRAAGANGLEVGGKVDVTLTHYDTPGDRRSGRNWKITYTPAGNATLMGDDQPAQAPAPAQQAAPAQPAQEAPAAGGGESPAEKVKALHGLGLTPAQIAQQTQLDESVVQMLIAA